MNKYFSSDRTFMAKAMMYRSINPPADLVVVAEVFRKNVFIRPRIINPQSNFIIKGFSLNCNFEDGLVWKDRSRPYVSFRVRLLKEGAVLPGTVSVPTVNQLIGSGAIDFTTELPSGQYISIAPLGSSQSAFISQVDSVVGPTELYFVDDMPTLVSAGSVIRKLSTAGGGSAVKVFDMAEVPAFGEFVHTDAIFDIRKIPNFDDGYDFINIEAFLHLTENWYFETKSIDPSFFSVARFDIETLLEITGV